jgi:hypothetical protein
MPLLPHLLLLSAASLAAPAGKPSGDPPAPLSCSLCGQTAQLQTQSDRANRALSRAIRSWGSRLLSLDARRSGTIKTLIVAPGACAIPLLRVPVDENVDPKMNLQSPDSPDRMPAVRVLPPCDEASESR